MSVLIKDLGKRIAQIPLHTNAMPAQAESPVEHFRLGSREAWNLLIYFERKTKAAPGYEKPLAKHTTNLRNMTILALVDAFERYLKEAAAVCVDHLIPYTVDDRTSGFKDVPAARLVAHFDENSVGRALCESSTWSNAQEIEARLNPLLQALDGTKWTVLPKDPKDSNAWRRGTLDVLFQLRHTIAHNLALITRSDAIKFRRLTRASVEAPRMLAPTSGDVWYVKSFFDETVAWLNARMATRLADVLSLLRADGVAIDLSKVGQEVADRFQVAVTIASATFNPS